MDSKAPACLLPLGAGHRRSPGPPLPITYPSPAWGATGLGRPSVSSAPLAHPIAGAMAPSPWRRSSRPGKGGFAEAALFRINWGGGGGGPQNLERGHSAGPKDFQGPVSREEAGPGQRSQPLRPPFPPPSLPHAPWRERLTEPGEETAFGAALPPRPAPTRASSAGNGEQRRGSGRRPRKTVKVRTEQGEERV